MSTPTPTVPEQQPQQVQPQPPVQQGPQIPPVLPTPPVAPPPKRRRPKIWQWALIGVGVLVVVVIIATAIRPSTSPTMPQATQAPAATATPKPPTAATKPATTPTPVYAHFGDGTYQVGKDIQPGTYRTRAGSSGCYYARLSGFGGTLDEITANNNTDAPAIVTIAASDKGFESRNCGTWTADLSQITQSKTSFGDGTYIVGTDIEAGTYKNTGSEGCYFARLSGFGGSLGEIIANDNVATTTFVTIAPSDKGFTASRCGTWTKQ